MNRINRLFLLLLLLIAGPIAGSEVAVECVGVTTDAQKTRLIFATATSVAHQVFTLDGPDRVVLDIANAKLIGALPQATAKDPTLIGLRSGVRHQADLRIVIDLKRAVRIKSFAIPAPERQGHQLIVDLLPREPPQAGSARAAERAPTVRVAGKGVPRTAIIAIDAGHGGEDPGALGPGGTREKDITLAIAQKLAKLVDQEPGMRALMIRDSDVFIGLRERILKAREQRADLLISLHADAFPSTDVHGSSVYTLSNGGASSEAAMLLADRENSVDPVGGVDISASDDVLATVLLDMTQNATIEQSTEVASAVLSALGQVCDMHKTEVQRAGFVVLKAPDIPSLLVETAFISNATEEARLKTNAHQQRLAQAMLAGLRRYFKKFPLYGFQSAATDLPAPAASSRRSQTPPREVSARQPARRVREYVINAGDTLSGIAKRHQVSLSSLRAENGLEEGDTIRAGQILAIPTGT